MAADLDRIHRPRVLTKNDDEPIAVARDGDLLQLAIDIDFVMHGYRRASSRARARQRALPVVPGEAEVATAERDPRADCSAAATAARSSSNAPGSENGCPFLDLSSSSR